MDKSISDFWIIGVNYKKTDATLRGKYAINDEQYALILDKATAVSLKEFFILSTCNRTEIYGLSRDPGMLIELLCSETEGDLENFKQHCYSKNGLEAVEHLFNVASGLDSQVLGDYEILGQVKNAARFSKSKGFVGPFLERLINSALQSSKAVKTTTSLSGGIVSVSFAAVQYIRNNVADYSKKQILLLGTGKIGRNTTRNLVDYLDNKNITLVNRTPEKAIILAKEIGLKYAPMEEVTGLLQTAEIIITSTNAAKSIITNEDLKDCIGNKLIIDLSIPYNVDPKVSELPGISLKNVDELSKMKDETLHKREAEVPRAKEVIRQHMDEFMDWLHKRRHVPVLKSLKLKLEQINTDEQKIQKVLNVTAVKLQTMDTRGCHYIEAINEFIAVQ